MRDHTRIKISVTKEDIRLGARRINHTEKCPIARALKVALKSFRNRLTVRVYSPVLTFGSPFCGYKVALPKKATTFQRRLMADSTANVKPFSFYVQIPNEALGTPAELRGPLSLLREKLREIRRIEKRESC